MRKVINAHSEGIAPRDLITEAGLSKATVTRSLQRIRDEFRIEGTRATRRYYPKDGTSRPKRAPAGNGRATPAPAKPDETRPEPETAPKEIKPASPKAEARAALLQRIEQAVLELVADSEPLTADEIDTMIIEQLDVERSDVERVRSKLAGGSPKRGTRRKLERRPEGYRLVRTQATVGPITEPEREAVASLGSGRTAREVAANCDRIRNATDAALILEGLCRRDVVRRRPDSQPTVYEGTGPVASGG